MTLNEYLIKARQEIIDMESKWNTEHIKDPAAWPMEMDEAEWVEQELAMRFE